MNISVKKYEKRELTLEDVDQLIALFDALRSEILRCQDQYRQCLKGDQGFDLDYWYDRILLPSNLCADIVTKSRELLFSMFNPGEGYERSFSGTENIFRLKPQSIEAFLAHINHLKSTLIPLVLLYLHSMRNPENQVKSTELVLRISGLVTEVIRIRGEDKELKNWEAIDKGSGYFPGQMSADNR